MVIDLATHLMIEVRKAENAPTEQDDWDWDDPRWNEWNAEVNGVIYKKCGLIEGGTYSKESFGDLEVLKVHNSEEVDVPFLDPSFELIATVEEVLEGSLKDEFLT